VDEWQRAQAPGLADLDDYPDDEPHPRIFFSLVEVAHLSASVIVLTVAFSLIMGARTGAGFGFVLDVDALLTLLPFAAMAVVPAFILHELAHKIAAQRRHMWAEFRANFLGLFGGLAMTAFTGFLFAVPGAVHIVGHASKRDSGVISIVGPIVNLVIGYGAMFSEPLFPPIRVAGFGSFFELLVLLNGILAGFNMLPIGPLDGRKVLRWSWLAFVGMWLMVIGLFVLQFA